MAQNNVNGDPDDAHPEVDLGALMDQARQPAQAKREPSAPSTATTPAEDTTRPDVEDPIQRNVNTVQAELNASTVRVFGTIVESLRSLQERLDALEGGRSGEQTDWVSAMLETIDRKIDAVADQTATLDRHVNGEVADLRQALRASAQEIDGRLDSEVALNARARQDAVALEERLVRALDELMRGMHASVNGVEAWMRQETERSSRASRRLGDVEDRLARAFDQLSQDVSERLATIESRLGRTHDDIGQDVWSRIRALEDRLGEIQDGDAREPQQVAKRIEELASTVRELGAQMRSLSLTLGALEERLEHDLNEMRMRVLRAARGQSAMDQHPATTREAASEPGASAESSPAESPARPPSDEGSESAATTRDRGFDYFMFEHQFRGTVADVKRRQAQYVELFGGKQRVLDLGCGRGELMELLVERGINVTGVDHDQDMVEFCWDRGLHVVQRDLFEYLESLRDGSVDGIFTAQVIEHLPPEAIIRLIALCGDKLESGGVIVAESVNPGCPRALGDFFLDPSHVRPVPAEMIRFMLEQGPFNVQALRFSSPIQESDVPPVLETISLAGHDISPYQVYAVIARRD